MERSGVDVRGGFGSASGPASSPAPQPPSSLAESSSFLFNAAVGSSLPPARRRLLFRALILKGRRPYYATLTFAAPPDSDTRLEPRTVRKVCCFASSARSAARGGLRWDLKAWKSAHCDVTKGERWFCDLLWGQSVSLHLQMWSVSCSRNPTTVVLGCKQRAKYKS